MNNDEKNQLQRSDAGESLVRTQGLCEETRRGRNIFNTIGGGSENSIERTSFNGITGGQENRIFNSSNNSFIGGGRANVIGDANIEAWQGHGVIGGGQNNLIEGVSNWCTGQNACHSFIGGGIDNIVRSQCSSIIGGQANTIPVNMPNSHIIGSNIVLNPGVVGNANSLHVNGLWANGIPNWPFAGGTPGTIFGLPAGAPPPPVGARPLWIM